VPKQVGLRFLARSAESIVHRWYDVSATTQNRVASRREIYHAILGDAINFGDGQPWRAWNAFREIRLK